MTALDARLALALMAKAQQVFGAPGQVLAFPLGGSAYPVGHFNFVPTGGDAQALRTALAALADFSSLVHTLPHGQVFMAEGGRGDLPQVYRQVLEQAEVATPVESDSDRQALATARALLVNRNLDGSEVDTPLYTAYKECRDLWLLASQQYNAARISGEFGADDAARQAWQLNEPVLQTALDKAAQAWEVRGRRTEVEAALARIDALTQHAPISQWHDWNLRSQPGVGTLTDLSGQAFWPCYISPANACEVGWQQMVLSRGEVDALQDSAPADMKARLGAGTTTLDVEQLQFEFTSAKLQRPWFDSRVFTSRFWRARPGGDLQLSQGEPPWTGACPLYASAVVFFRRIRAVVKGDSTAAHTAGEGASQALDLGLIRPTWRTGLADAPVEPAGDTGAAIEVARVATAAEAAVNGRVSAMRGAEGLGGRVMAAGLGGLKTGALRADDDSGPGAIGVIRRPAWPARLRFSDQALMDSQLILREPDWSPAPVEVPTPPAAGHSVLATDDNEVFILAFICTAVPKSPDPDPALVWPPAA